MKMNPNILFVCFFIFTFISCSHAPVHSEAKRKARILYDHGTQKLVEKDYTQALDSLLKAEKLDPEDSSIQNNLGMSYYFKNHPKEAKEHLLKALTLDPKNSDARNNYASLLYVYGDTDEAEKQFKTVLEDLTFPSIYTTYYNLALLKLKKKKTSEAVEYLKKTISENSDYCPAYYVLGGIMKKNYELVEAAQYFTKGTQGTCYQHPASFYELALLKMEMGEAPLAKIKFKEILDRFPDTEYAMLSEKKLKELQGYRASKETIQQNKESQAFRQEEKVYSPETF